MSSEGDQAGRGDGFWHPRGTGTWRGSCGFLWVVLWLRATCCPRKRLSKKSWCGWGPGVFRVEAQGTPQPPGTQLCSVEELLVLDAPGGSSGGFCVVPVCSQAPRASRTPCASARLPDLPFLVSQDAAQSPWALASHHSCGGDGSQSLGQHRSPYRQP